MTTRAPREERSFGVLFPHNPAQGLWSGHWMALAQAAHAMGLGEEENVLVYYGLATPRNEAVRNMLLEDLRHHRLAGLLCATDPTDFLDGEVRAAVDVPAVAILSHPGPHGVAVLREDNLSWVRKAADHLVARHRRHAALLLAHIGAGPGPNFLADVYLPHLRAKGVVRDPPLVQSLFAYDAEAQERAVLSLLLDPPERRPDALIVTDDNLVEAVTHAVRARGLAVPETLDVVAHANYPCPPPAHVPVFRIGYDARELLRLAMDHCRRAAAGERVPREYVVPARTEAEAGGTP